MKNTFTLVWSFRNRLDKLKESIRTADETCSRDVDFCLIDASSDESVIRELRAFCNSIEDRAIRVAESTYRSSLSEAWNLGMMLTDSRYVIFTSSDSLFLKPGWFKMLRDKVVNENYEYVLFNNHSLFAVDKKAIPKMGWFDESFGIGPHFDVDFMIRASENNVRFSIISASGFYTNTGIGGNYMDRIKNPQKDYLPMNDYMNEDIFNSKWYSSWIGWRKAVEDGMQDLPHPPTHISQVKRLRAEIDEHPSYSRKYREDKNV